MPRTAGPPTPATPPPGNGPDRVLAGPPALRNNGTGGLLRTPSRGPGVPTVTPLLFLVFAAPQAPLPDVDDSVVRRLVAALKDPDPEVRGNLAVALAKVG